MNKISQRLEQKQKLSPKQILEANILQLNYYNLEKRIIEELESNPILELEEDNDVSNGQDQDEEDNDKLDWEELDSDPQDQETFYNTNKDRNIENIGSKSELNLSDDILSQLYDLNYSDDKIIIAKEILGNLNERGFLTIEPILLSDRLNISESEVNEIIDQIKSLDPPGLASNSIQDCIISQINANYPDEKFCIKIIKNYFDDFVNKRYSKIKKRTNCSDEELYKVIELVSVLNPNPAINYSVSINEHIIPDIAIEKIDGKWNVLINEPNYSNLRINKKYLKMANNKDKDVKNFVKSKINNGKWFIDAIKSRIVTIEKVVKSIIKFQDYYFNSDDRVLSPMILKDIADDINMDISTISRVANSKHVQMPWGIKKLKFFFTEGINMNDGTTVSNMVLKKEIINLINSENKKSPLTDDKLKELLNKKGFKIARRTVTKYREILKYPQSRLRKTLF